MDFGPRIFWDPREPPPPHLLHLQVQVQHEAVRQPWPGPHRVHREVPVPAPVLHHHHRADRRRIHDENRAAVNNGVLRPISASVNVRITHDTARVKVTQKFINNTNFLIPKASYTFPLPQGSTVVDFSCQIGRDRILIGKVKPVDTARRTFEESVSRGQTAGLLDQNSQELFTTTIGHLMANTEVKATLCFILLLKHDLKVDDNVARTVFTLPSYIAPRYGTPPDNIGSLLEQSAVAKKLSISVEILAATDIVDLTCPSHPNTKIQVGLATRQRWVDFIASRPTRDARCATARLPEETNDLDRDFTLSLCTTSTTAPEMPFACLEKHPADPGQSALMVTIPAKFLIGPPREYPGGEIIFIADRSGSMSDKIKALRNAMEFFLAGLPSGSMFNVWSFGSDFSSLWPRSKPYDPSNHREAQRHVNCDFHANLGGTEILPVLRTVVKRLGGLANADIIILTDGHIWHPEETLEFVKRTKSQSEGRVRFFSLGIGNAVSHELVEGIAKAGGGYAEVIQTASQGGWEERMLAVLKAAVERHVLPGPITLEWAGDTGIESSTETLQSPHDVSKVSPFLRNRVFMLLSGSGENPVLPSAVKINYNQPGLENEHVEIPVSILKTPDTTIHKFAARALLGDLERGESKFHADPNRPSAGSTEELDMLRLQGEALGCKWSLVSKWTSFVAVEERVSASRSMDDEDHFSGSDQEDSEATTDQNRTLDLLRPRGVPNIAQLVHGNPRHSNSDSESTESEDDDENDTPSDLPRNDRDDSHDGPDPRSGNHPPSGGGNNNDGSQGDHASPPTAPGYIGSTTAYQYGPSQSQSSYSRPSGYPESGQYGLSSAANYASPITSPITSPMMSPAPQGRYDDSYVATGANRDTYGAYYSAENSPPFDRYSTATIPPLSAVFATPASGYGASAYHSQMPTSGASGHPSILHPQDPFMGQGAQTGQQQPQGYSGAPGYSYNQVPTPVPLGTAPLASGDRPPQRVSLSPQAPGYPSSSGVASQSYAPHAPLGPERRRHSSTRSEFSQPSTPGFRSSRPRDEKSSDSYYSSRPRSSKVRVERERLERSPSSMEYTDAYPLSLAEEPIPGSGYSQSTSASQSNVLSAQAHGNALSLSPPTQDSRSRLSALDAPIPWQIVAPQNNLPSASALQFAAPVSNADPIENGKRELVRALLPFQPPSGEFLCEAQNWSGTKTAMPSVLGSSFEALIAASRVHLSHTIPRMAGSDPKSLDSVARTASLITLLERHFQLCKDLWRDMERHASRYLQSKLLVSELVLFKHFLIDCLDKATFHLEDPGGVYSTAAPVFIQVRLPIPGHAFQQITSILPNLQYPEVRNVGSGTESKPTAQLPSTTDWLSPVSEQKTDVSDPGPDSSSSAGTGAGIMREISTQTEQHSAPRTALPPSQNEKEASAYADASLERSMDPKSTSRAHSPISEHESLIQKIAAEREAKGRVVSGEETEVPEDI